jgi:hypothetical protein
VPTRSVLDVGVAEAARDLLSSTGGGFDKDAFDVRNGGFYKQQRGSGGGCGGASAGSSAVFQLRFKSEDRDAIPLPSDPPSCEDEIEVKFSPPPGLLDSLLLQRIGRQIKPPVRSTFTDTYFDTPDGECVDSETH